MWWRGRTPRDAKRSGTDGGHSTPGGHRSERTARSSEGRWCWCAFRAGWRGDLRVWALLLLGLGVVSGCARTGVFGENTADVRRPGLIDAGDAAVDVALDVPDDVAPDLVEDVAPDVVGVCGDGVVEGLEQCDEGADNSDVLPDACREDCTLPRCGDGVVDTGEPCDDGNGVDNDACSNGCREPGTPCFPCDESEACGREIDRCARLLDGQFCLQACTDEGGCAPGEICDAVRTAEGDRETQCVPELEVCSPCFDRDGDGYGIGVECLGPDCNDDNPAINPGAVEICNDVDDNCNDENDEVCPPDLIVDAETVELSGAFLFDHVWIRNGGTVVVTPYEGDAPDECSPDGPGCLTLEARIIEVLANSGIDANGAGDCRVGRGVEAGFGPGLSNVGPSGGGHGGEGGAGPGLVGGRPYGAADDSTNFMGAAGGGFAIVDGFGLGDSACNDLVGLNSAGGRGGGCIGLLAPDVIVDGFLRANGTNGQAAPSGSRPAIVDGGAGGAGGGILISGERVRISAGAALTARGGAGGRGGRYSNGGAGVDGECVGNGGGGGGGGRIKVFATRTLNNRGGANANGGTGAEGPQNDATAGTRGSLLFEGP